MQRSTDEVKTWLKDRKIKYSWLAEQCRVSEGCLLYTSGVDAGLPEHDAFQNLDPGHLQGKHAYRNLRIGDIEQDIGQDVYKRQP